MATSPARHARRRFPSARVGFIIAWALLLTSSAAQRGWGADEPAVPNDTHYYSTAAPPVEYPGPTPTVLDAGDPVPAASAPEPVPGSDRVEPEKPADAVAAPSQSPRLANVPSETRNHVRTNPTETPAPKLEAAADPIVLAKKTIADCRVRYGQVRDYTCTFFKRERIDGKMTGQHVMQMKSRTKPFSVYFKFAQPNKGREAIYVAGRHGGKAMVHDVGIGKLIAGTLALDPRGSRAMEDCRHPITEAGIGHLIDTVAERWGAEMKQGETLVAIHHGAKVGNRACTMIESKHPQKAPNYMFHMVRLYVDDELGLPIRFEAYDWPRRRGIAPELVEEYTYANLRTNVGLRESDFDPSNAQYSFGHF
jgi:hypothetical protein